MLHIVPRLSGCIEAVPCCRYAVHATAALTVPSHCPCLYDRCLAAGSCSASYRRCSLCCGKHVLEFCAFRICIPGPVSVENPDTYAEILVVPSVIDFSVLEQQVVVDSVFEIQVAPVTSLGKSCCDSLFHPVPSCSENIEEILLIHNSLR